MLHCMMVVVRLWLGYFIDTGTMTPFPQLTFNSEVKTIKKMCFNSCQFNPTNFLSMICMISYTKSVSINLYITILPL